MNKITWQAPEYEERERSNDWFWAVGVIFVTSTIAAVIYGNYFFAGLLALSGALLAFFAIKKPDMVDYELNSNGLRIRNRTYPYEQIKSFWVRADIKPMLFIKSGRVFIPVISIPIEDSMAEDMRDVFLAKNVIEVEMQEHASEKIMETLGF